MLPRWNCLPKHKQVSLKNPPLKTAKIPIDKNLAVKRRLREEYIAYQSEYTMCYKQTRGFRPTKTNLSKIQRNKDELRYVLWFTGGELRK